MSDRRETQRWIWRGEHPCVTVENPPTLPPKDHLCVRFENGKTVMVLRSSLRPVVSGRAAETTE